MKRRVWCLLGLLALSACKSKVTEQGVVVSVSNPSNVAGIFWLRVSASNRGSNPVTLLLPDAPQSTPISFPTSFSLSVPASRNGEVDIVIDGLNSSFAVVANGTAFALLQASSFVNPSVLLQAGVSLCGNGNIDPGESCDDGNRYSGDGCSYLCKSETAADAALSGVDVGAGETSATDGAAAADGATIGAGGAGGSLATGGATGSGGTADTGGTLGAGSATVPITVPVVDCGPLASLANGSVSAPTTTVGSTATYACTTGYGPSGSSTRLCLPRGAWSGDTPTCVIANCPALAGPSNGMVSAPTLTYGSVATYACLPGYTLSMSKTRSCQPDGTWDGNQPTCGPVDCGKLPAPANGYVSAPNTTYGSTAAYSCAVGYGNSSRAPRICQADGTWSGTAPTCAPVDCGTLTPPTNGSVSVPVTTLGSTATYSCSPGYGPSGSSTRTCQADGNWTGVAPTCVIANCPALASPSNGQVAAPTLTFGSTAQYTCFTGYGPVGIVSRSCQPDGTWSGSAPTCTPVDCKAPSAPANGTVTATTTTFGSTATYACNTGYTPTATATSTCQASGSWSGTVPTCTLVDCLAPAPPANGSVVASPTTYGSTATYSCSTGCVLSSSTPSTCQANGKWSGTTPVCSPANCGAAPVLTNGSVTVTATACPMTATYSCVTGYELSGNPTRTCQANGAWDGSLPTCKAGMGMTCAVTSDCSSSATCCDGSNESCDGTKLPTGDGTNTGQFVVSGDQLTVSDTITGLVWQHDGSGTRTGCSGPGNFTCTWAEANNYCAGLALGDLSGWRLPAVMELLTIVDLVRTSPPSVDPTAFLSTPSASFWSSSLYAGSSGNGWIASFTNGYSNLAGVGVKDRVRCVRGSRCYPTSRFTVLSDGTVKDTLTQLVWQQDGSGTRCTDSNGNITNYCSYEKAMTYCSKLNLGGNSKDWRLPTVKELSSIVDFTVAPPQSTINQTAFPNTPAEFFWTSSPYAGSSGYAGSVYFRYGYTNNYAVGNCIRVRCVR